MVTLCYSPWKGLALAASLPVGRKAGYGRLRTPSIYFMQVSAFARRFLCIVVHPILVHFGMFGCYLM